MCGVKVNKVKFNKYGYLQNTAVEHNCLQCCYNKKTKCMNM